MLQNSPGLEGAELAEFENEMRAIFVDMMQTLGLPKSYGEIYGLLYATPRPLAFTDIHERLPLSKGSVSGGLRALRDIGALKVVVSDVGRRERFEPELEVRKLLFSFLKERLKPQLEENGLRIGKLVNLLEGEILEDSLSREVMKHRLDKLDNWRKRVSGLIPWISRFIQ